MLEMTGVGDVKVDAVDKVFDLFAPVYQNMALGIYKRLMVSLSCGVRLLFLGFGIL